MTQEQIKESAEIYARYNSRANNTAYYAYIAGAHSRDEEIRQLESGMNNETLRHCIEFAVGVVIGFVVMFLIMIL